MPTWRQMSLAGTPASACLRVAMICVSVNFDVRMELPDCETMPERSTYAVSAVWGSLRSYREQVSAEAPRSSGPPRSTAEQEISGPLRMLRILEDGSANVTARKSLALRMRARKFIDLDQCRESSPRLAS
jgi:hypothetical protein